MQSWLSFCSEHIIAIILGFLLFLACLLLRNKVAGSLGKLAGKLLKKWPTYSAAVQHALKEPFAAYLPFLGAYLGCLIVQPGTGIMTFVSKVIRIAGIILVTWVLMNLTPVFSSATIKINEQNRRSSAMAIKFVSNVLKVIIVALGVAVVISELGYNINGIITGLGIGGLTLSLAAQNTASNLLAGFEIVADKPFDVGDYIETASAEGTVEDMTMRSTRIRTITDTLVVVPNSILMNEAVTNHSRMGRRYENTTIGLTYDTSNQVMEAIIKDIQDMLYHHEDVDNQRIVVCFKEFNDSSLDINIIYFTTTTDRDEFFKIREDVNFKIREIVERNGADFAFPSTSVYLENQN